MSGILLNGIVISRWEKQYKQNPYIAKHKAWLGNWIVSILLDDTEEQNKEMKNREAMTRMENLGHNTWVETFALI